MSRTPKREGELKAGLLSYFVDDEDFMILNHADRRRYGVPDWSVTGRKQSTWWEFKHGTPSFESPEIQLLTCRRLAVVGVCWYVIWREDRKTQRTLIVSPQGVFNHLRQGQPLDHQIYAQAPSYQFDHQWLAWFIKSQHGVK